MDDFLDNWKVYLSQNDIEYIKTFVYNINHNIKNEKSCLVLQGFNKTGKMTLLNNIRANININTQTCEYYTIEQMLCIKTTIFNFNIRYMCRILSSSKIKSLILHNDICIITLIPGQYIFDKDTTKHIHIIHLIHQFS